MQQQIFEALASLIAVSFTTILGIVAKEVVRYIRTHQKTKLASMAVKFAEETFKDFSGQQKFIKASEWLAFELTNVGVKNVTSQEIEGLVQSAVKDMKGAFAQAEANNPASDSTTRKDAVPSTPDQAPITAQAPVRDKPIFEMTSADLKQLIAQVIQEEAKPD